MAIATMRSGEALGNPKHRGLTGSDSRVATMELQDLAARELVDHAGERRWAQYSMPCVWLKRLRDESKIRFAPGWRRAA
jgi:ATP-dependent DNA helicase RecG